MNEQNQQSQLPWHAHSIADVFLAFKSSQRGISESEVKDRIDEYGLNELPRQAPKSGFKILFVQFANPLMVILIIAALISALMQEWLDTGVIIFAVLLNAVLGFIEEYKADRSMEQLKSFLPQRARVRRGGVERMIDASNIVPGDIVLLGTGDKITADGRIVLSQSLEVSEAALTGESVPVEKQKEQIKVDIGVTDRVNMLYAGTVIVAGRCEMIVTSTGVETQIGKITLLVAGVEETKTPLQEQMGHFARWLGAAVLFITLIVFAAGLIRGFELLEMIRVSVALAVSAIPEGLVVALTVILAIGMQRILKKRALVRRLVAAETLGSVSVICMDKTGTLTTGEMAIVEACDSSGSFSDKVDAFMDLSAALWSTKDVFVDEVDNESFSGSPTEVAIVKALWEDREKYELQKCQVISEIPFNSKYKYKARVCSFGDRKEFYVVGAPEILLERLDATDAQLKEYHLWLTQMIQKGLRVLLVAKQKQFSGDQIDHEQIHDLSFIGFVGLSDPLRASARETIAKAKLAGLLPVMITGDHPDTAFYIAKEAGLIESEDQILTGAELDELDDVAFDSELEKIVVYARVLPRHKLRIVNAWKSKGMSVAMVGDGVNDAPAVKAADIGIALGSGTEVAKETADMVLLDNHFGTIVSAIEQGRAIFENIRKMVVYLLADSFSEIILIFGAIIFGLPLPILPAQILWINLVTDGFPSIALTFEKAEDGIMQEPPRKKHEPILNKEMKIIIFIIGIISDLILFAIYFYLLGQEMDIDHIRTFIFVALGINSLFYVFAVRKFRTSVFHSNPFENMWLVFGIFVGFLFLLVPMLVPILREWFALTPLTLLEWFVLIGIAFLQLLLIELVKMVFNRKKIKAE
ncbi:cation-translocating P-type ATPase [Candidatus Uhrbacteria bacterium]|jgi:P-type Ca2+ transporter type 2C|nr:cation-translocating P-type ATPase [Candidatus Uhrbacteria bacterium]MBT7716967.1 cation-translocating P-type ATPase [Candidatus Uhrbacteria bacterium]